MTHPTDKTNHAAQIEADSPTQETRTEDSDPLATAKFARIADLPGIDPATAEAALAELGLTEAEFWALDADRFQAVMAEHFERVEAWLAREGVRLARCEATRAGIQGVPEDMSIWHAGQEGFIGQGAARDALCSVFQLQQSQDTDPAPDAEAVAALLNAVFPGASDGSTEQ